MKKLFLVAFILLLALFASCLENKEQKSNLVEQEVGYISDSTVLKGYLVYDKKLEGKRPGVLVVHEWWGHNEYARKRARMLAELGYTALAVDMYGAGKQASHPSDAGKFSSEATKSFEVARARFQAAQEFLSRQPQVDGKRLAAIG